MNARRARALQSAVRTAALVVFFLALVFLPDTLANFLDGITTP